MLINKWLQNAGVLKKDDTGEEEKPSPVIKTETKSNDETLFFDESQKASSFKDLEFTPVSTPDSKQADHVIASGEWKINFAVGKSDVLPSSYDDLNSLYNLLVQGGESVRINIEGHTDNTGNEEMNKLLSMKRANAVSDYLVQKGLNYKKIQNVTGVGSTKPLSDNNTQSGRDRNRRVQVTILN